MRVLVNGYGAYFGGIVRVHNSVCRELAASTDLHVANAPRGQVELSGAAILSRQSSSRVRSLIADLVVALSFMRFDVRIDTAPAFRFFTRARRHIVIVHDLNFLNPSVHGISWKQRIYRELLHRWTLRRVDLVVVNSLATLRELLSYRPAVAAKAMVLPLPVDYMAGEPEEPEAHGGIRALSFGHARNKGVDRLLRAMQERPDIELTVIAPPQAWNENWKAEAIEAGVMDRVRVVGPLADDEVRREYLRADVFCMLSTYEGYGLPAAEALYLGRPTVISDLRVLRETTRGHAVVATDQAATGVLAAMDEAVARPPVMWAAAGADFRGWNWASWVAKMLEETP